MEVFRLNRLTKTYRDVFTWIRNCMSTKVFVENLPTGNIDAFHGDLNMPRFRFFSYFFSHSSVFSSEYFDDHLFYLFMWQRYVSDFYISDFQSGLRALVKAGNGSKVSPFVIPTTVANVTSQTKDLSPSFLQWLADRNLSNDSRAMRLKEGYGIIYTCTFDFLSATHLHPYTFR